LLPHLLEKNYLEPVILYNGKAKSKVD